MFLTNWFRPPKRIGFDEVLHAIRHPDKYIIINTLPLGEQDCLIQNTVSVETEETVVNSLLTVYDPVVRKIVIYGKNSTDSSVEHKHSQLLRLGIGDVYIYSGGLFEWMLLQDIYGHAEFPTTKTVVDILQFKPATMEGFV
jgi:hypothetical protein